MTARDAGVAYAEIGSGIASTDVLAASGGSPYAVIGAALQQRTPDFWLPSVKCGVRCSWSTLEIAPLSEARRRRSRRFAFAERMSKQGGITLQPKNGPLLRMSTPASNQRMRGAIIEMSQRTRCLVGAENLMYMESA
jgi:hypothetical protein